MSIFLALATGFTRVWTMTYTLGMRASDREARRAEIESDLWDHQRFASLQDESALATACNITIRTSLGFRSDIAWRVEGGFSRGEERTIAVPETTAGRLGLLVGLVIALIPIAFGVSFMVQSALASDGEWAGWAFWGVIMVLVGATIIVGLLQTRRSPRRGMALVAAGVIAMCVFTFWMAFITVPLGIALLVLANFRMRAALRQAPLRPA